MYLYLLYPLFYLISILPRRCRRGASAVLRWVLHDLVHYRVQVVRDNLGRSFPEKSIEELRVIEHKFYAHLADVFIETILVSTIRQKEMIERVDFINKEQIERYTQGRSWISAMAHYGSWEYTTGWGLHSTHDRVLAVYRPLASKTFDRFFRRTRSRFGVQPVAMDRVARTLVECHDRGECVTLALIADQNPPRVSDNWVRFLGQPTLFFNGMEKLARKFHMPVAFLHMDKFGNDHYKGWFELIYDGQEELPEGEITRRYAMRLEEVIRKRPELWMWSHRRWKHTPPEGLTI